MESEGTLPKDNIQLGLRLQAHMESEESTGDDEDSRVDARQCLSKDRTNDKETHTTSEYLGVL